VETERSDSARFFCSGVPNENPEKLGIESCSKLDRSSTTVLSFSLLSLLAVGCSAAGPGVPIVQGRLRGAGWRESEPTESVRLDFADKSLIGQLPG